jgi:hypothetical protein
MMIDLLEQEKQNVTEELDKLNAWYNFEWSME